MLGSLLGLDGGIIIVLALTLLLHIDIRYAIGASIVSVIATSSGVAAAHVREHMTNLRVAMLLELGATSGALTGAYLAGVGGGRWLYIIHAHHGRRAVAAASLILPGTRGRVTPERFVQGDQSSPRRPSGDKMAT